MANTKYLQPINVDDGSRTGVTVFANEWRLCGESALASVFDLDLNWETISESVPVRAGQVISTFICWLGSNMGRTFLEAVDQEAENHIYKEKAYIATWALQNRRQVGINNGVRTFEFLLTPESTKEIVRPSYADHGFLELIFDWLGTDKGDQFVSECRRKISIYNQFESDLRWEQSGIDIPIEKTDKSEEQLAMVFGS